METTGACSSSAKLVAACVIGGIVLGASVLVLHLAGPVAIPALPPADALRRRFSRRRRRPAEQAVVYTVWKRSSMGFQGADGFSVYDSTGKLAFRVDNYSRRRKVFTGELLLMDGHGTPLLSLRPQMVSLRNRWNCYRAQEEGLDITNSPSVSQQVFSMRKTSALQGSDEAEVFMSTRTSDDCQPDASPSPSFRIDGSFCMRSCKIRRSNGEEAARISKKNAGVMSRPVSLGDDVFSLFVRPGVDVAVVMAIVVVMDRICSEGLHTNGVFIWCCSCSEWRHHHQIEGNLPSKPQ